jgi:hypothetical protein
MHENAAYPHGRCHTHPLSLAEGRIVHKGHHPRFALYSDNPNTNASQPCHNLHTREEKAHPSQAKLLDRRYKSKIFSTNSASIKID